MKDNKGFKTEKMTLREWLPLIGLMVSAFIFNTSEFMPIGLLSDIAADFQTTEAHTGMIITVYAWVVMLLSLPLMLLFSKMDVRRLLLGIVGLFGVFQMMSAFSTGYWMLMFARIGVACTHAVFWAVTPPAAVKVVSEKFRALALSMVVCSTSLAMVLGMPLGRMIGLKLGWNVTFLCIGIIAFLTFAYLFFVFPGVPCDEPFSVKQMPEILKSRFLMGRYLVTFLFAASYYTGYSYIEPFLQQAAGMKEELITMTLTLFGLAGLLGSFLFSKYFDKHRKTFIKCVMIGSALPLWLLLPLSGLQPALILLCAFWGMATIAYNVAFQSEIITYAPESAASVATAIYSGIFNMGIGSGSWLGGVVCTHLSIRYIGFVGGILAAVGAGYCILRLLRMEEGEKR